MGNRDFDDLMRIATAADPLGRRLYEEGPNSGLPPNAYAFALALALRAVCKEHGWTAAHLVGLLDDIFKKADEVEKVSR